MSDKNFNYIKSRLSLRKPQADSLMLLHELVQDLDIGNVDIQTFLLKAKELRPSFDSFEFDFPSLCFALATGVGKTRLMGAMIYYLYKEKGIRNFFVVAPNLTIYDKLISDFTYGSKKYVFRGLADIDSQNPLIIHGDNYNDVNHALNQGLGLENFQQGFSINVFNISKFNSSKEKTKFKRISEFIGESYFDYLQGLEDLVVLMDESHRYRASSSMNSINELKPLLGLEFTATPFISGSKKKDFKNVFHAYNLANAIHDGFVKVPWVATRENTDTSSMNIRDLEYMKITDGIQLHEKTKAELQAYALENNKEVVKPFMMISAIDQNHADEIEAQIKSDDFFSGKYKSKVLTIYSSKKKSDLDAIIQLLLEVEKENNPIEIVIQVMMLKEGRDVNNLYTIVPLRASTSEILTEQTIGRGLRLPYGQRVGNDSVDRLTIVAHDKYQDVVQEANKPDSLVKNVINLNESDRFTKKTEVIVSSQASDFDDSVLESAVSSGQINEEEAKELKNAVSFSSQKFLEDRKVSSYSELKNEETPKEMESFLADAFSETSEESSIAHSTKLIFGKLSEEQQSRFIETSSISLVSSFVNHSIKIPRVDIDYGESSVTFDTNFNINTTFVSGLLSQESAIRLQSLLDNKVEKQKSVQKLKGVSDPVDYIVSIIMDIPDLDYDLYSDFIYKIANQIVAQLRVSFAGKSDDEITYNVYVYKPVIYQNLLKQLTSPEVMSVTREEPKAFVRKSISLLQPSSYSVSEGQLLDYKDSFFPANAIKSYVFAGFSKCCYTHCKFDSTSEKVFATILEEEERVSKWMKPPEKVLRIGYHYDNNHHYYNPDFIVETDDVMYMIEPKASNQVEHEQVQAKKDAALLWIDTVNSSGKFKEWKYVLLAHDTIKETYTFDYLVSAGS